METLLLGESCSTFDTFYHGSYPNFVVVCYLANWLDSAYPRWEDDSDIVVRL